MSSICFKTFFSACSFGIILLGLSQPLSAQSGDTDRNRYQNARFGYSFSYPADFSPGPPSENGDGRVFYGYDGNVEIRAYAAVPFLDEISSERSFALRALLNRDAHITYSPQGSGWFVLSGYTSDGRVYYNRAIRTLDCSGEPVTATVSMSYPKTHKHDIETKIGWITKSLKGCR